MLLSSTSALALPNWKFRFLFGGTEAEKVTTTTSTSVPGSHEALEIESQVIPDGADLILVADAAARTIEKLRKEHPNLGPISINLVKWNPDDTSGIGEEVARMIHNRTDESNKFVIEPSKSFHKSIRVAKTNLYEAEAEARASSLRWKLSWVRFGASASLTSVSLIIANAPTGAILAGALTAGLISKHLLSINTYGNEFVNRNPWFDKDGSRILSGEARWRLAYGSWKTLKQSAISLGFITSIHAMTCVFGGEQAILNSGVSWLAKSYLLGALPAALSFGKLKQIEHDILESALKENSVRNFSHKEAGVDGAYKALKTSYISAIVISALSVSCETLSLTSGWTVKASFGLQVSIGVIAFAEYTIRKSGYRDWYLEKKPAVLREAARKIMALKRGCGRLFSN